MSAMQLKRAYHYAQRMGGWALASCKVRRVKAAAAMGEGGVPEGE
jgi:hypothetical protein